MFKLYLEPGFPEHGQVAACMSYNYFHLPLALGLQVLTLKLLADFWGEKLHQVNIFSIHLENL